MDIQPLGDDFVNRHSELTTFLELIGQTPERRVLLIGGETGIGKSYLLNEGFAQCQARDIAYVHIDLTESLEPGYLAVAGRVWEQLGPDGFEALEQAMVWAQDLGSWSDGRAALGPTAPLPASSISAHVGDVEAGAQVAVGQNITQIQAGVVNVLHRDDPLVQQRIESQVTAALRQCLYQQTGARLIVFFIDAWEQATTDLRRWLSRSLLAWILDKQLPNALALVAGMEEPRLDRHPLRIQRVVLRELDEAAFRDYWVKKRKLPADEAANVFAVCGGMPLLMRMIADRRARSPAPSRET